MTAPGSLSGASADSSAVDFAPPADAMDTASTALIEPGPPQPASPRTPHHHEVLIMLQGTMTLLVGALFVLTFIVQPYRIPSGSMENTLQIGDFLLVNKVIFGRAGPWRHLLAYEPVKRDDIVVFHYPVDRSLHLVKRVIAVPGDRVRLHNGRVLVDERAQKEPFALYVASYPSVYRDDFPSSIYTDPAVNMRWWMEMQHDVHDGELVVPPGEYFVLGDNRNDSLDSRYWGFVPRQNIVGEPFLVYFSILAPGRSEITGLSSDRLAHEHSWWSTLAGSARWDRIFHVIR